MHQRPSAHPPVARYRKESDDWRDHWSRAKQALGYEGSSPARRDSSSAEKAYPRLIEISRDGKPYFLGAAMK